MSDSTLRILVAGGAGYIGSVVSARLIERGHHVTILDNLTTGHSGAIHPDARFVRGMISDKDAVSSACRDGIDVVMHFAASIQVGESVRNPALYYRNNLMSTIQFIDALRDEGVNRLVFSSTAAVYGEPDTVPIPESALLAPVNPYGWTKRMVEQVLDDYDAAYEFRSVRLRYFNAGGAYGQFGEDHHPESHLIPLLLRAIMTGDPLTIFGNDFTTRDGSPVRDYIHVSDLADAHILAAVYLMDNSATDAFNLGTGRGYTVFEVLKAAERITGRTVPHTIGARRPGDSAKLVASPGKAISTLGWSTERTSLDDIIATAWEWMQRNPRGYED
jgi:UDP-glucose 4-epimerase